MVKPDPFTLVIFGASGDLTRRKLIPAVYNLFHEGRLPDDFAILGFARREKTDDSFAQEIFDALKAYSRIPPDDATWAQFRRRLHYHRGNFDNAEDFITLTQRLGSLPGRQHHLFYLAVQPDEFPRIVGQLRDTGLSCPAGAGDWSRVVIEKPFGRDIRTAQELNRCLHDAFDEKQIFRIDHYLGKETVQNILVFRFANSLWEPLWNQKYIDHVQITVSEDLGLEGRAHYYEESGALRDMVQNHMMHLLCFVAMESPMNAGADAVRDEKVKLLRSLRAFPEVCDLNGVVRAQYGPGMIAGKPVPGYLQETGVAPDSLTDTFVAFKTYIDNWRWAGVPFYLRTGKRLPARLTQITIHFKPVPQVLFNADPANPMPPNVLVMRIQPNEGIALRFQAKVPGLTMKIQQSQMGFAYETAFGQKPPEAYEHLLLDAALGDSTLFTRNDEVESAWRLVQPIIDGCAAKPVRPLPSYPAGSAGPKEADDLIQADGRRWEAIPG